MQATETPTGTSNAPLSERILQLHQVVGDAAVASGRPADAVRLLAVGKARTAQELRNAQQHGIGDFAENYAQEGADKVDMLPADDGICWHFIGSLQGNKSKLVANRFNWLHTVDRQKLALRLHQQRDQALPPLNVCLQVNIDADPAKSGVAPDALPILAEQVLCLSGLRLRGLMTMPSQHGDRRAAFARTRDCLEKLCKELSVQLDTLSMGSSDDFVDAILEGATMVRLGTAIFGPRPAKGPGYGQVKAANPARAGA